MSKKKTVKVEKDFTEVENEIEPMEAKNSNEEKGFVSGIKNNNWWISLLLAIPIGIFVNIITPAIQDKYSEYSEKAAISRIERIKAEYNDAKYFSENKEEFSIHMSSKIIQMTMIGAFTTIASAFLFLAQFLINKLQKKYSSRIYERKNNLKELNMFINLIFFGIMLIVAILIFNIGRGTLRDYENVKNFKEYEKMIIKELE
jgi:H+/gluconate symporter-like permease